MGVVRAIGVMMRVAMNLGMITIIKILLLTMPDPRVVAKKSLVGSGCHDQSFRPYPRYPRRILLSSRDNQENVPQLM